jgi:hypothetical protein
MVEPCGGCVALLSCCPLAGGIFKRNSANRMGYECLGGSGWGEPTCNFGGLFFLKSGIGRKL